VRYAAYEGAPGDGLSAQLIGAASTIRAALGAAPAIVPRLGSLDAWRGYARAAELFEHHQGRAALDAARAAATEDPDLVRAQLLIGVLANRDGFGSKAEAVVALEAARRPRPTNSRRDEQLATAIDALGDYGHWGSPEPIRQYLAAHPGDALAHWLAVRSGFPWREELLEQWLRDMPDDAEPHTQIGYWQLRTDLAAAEHSFREAIRLAPDNENGYDALADVLFRQGRYEEAMIAVNRALELAPGFGSTLAKAAEFSLAAGKLDRAAELGRAAADAVDPEAPQFPAVLRVTVGLMLRRGDSGAALAYLEEVAHAPRTASRAYIVEEMQAIVRALTGDREGALRSLEAAAVEHLNYQGEDLKPQVGYVGLLAAFDDRRALEELARTPEMLPMDAVEHSARQLLEARRAVLGGHPADALAQTQQLASMSHTGLMGLPFLALWTRARAFHAMGKRLDERDAYAAALRWSQSQPQWPEVSFFLPRVLAESSGG
jgi:tetratricopeptide (TPR) repeat protein